MRRMAFGLSLVLSAGCAVGYKASYVTGAVTKQFSTESYGVYSEQFNKKIDECCAGDSCDPESPDVITKTELDQCMGGHYKQATHEKIDHAIKVYFEAAKVHSAVMQIVEGNDEERKGATDALLDSAIRLLELLPDGDKLVSKLKKLTGR